MFGPPEFRTEEPVRRSANGWWMFVLLAVVAGVIGFRYVSQMQEPAFASDDRGSRSGYAKPVLLMFTADWCGPCQTFKATVLSNPAVAARVDRSCPLVKVDLTTRDRRAAEVARRYGVQGIPELILTDARGGEIARYNGPTDPQQFLRWLDRHAR
jgi:thiol:disulfide interchange protein